MMSQNNHEMPGGRETESPDILHIKSGVPFSLPVELLHDLVEVDEGLYAYDPVPLELDGFGKGYINVLKDAGFIDPFHRDESGQVRTPEGPISQHVNIYDGVISPADQSQLPVRFEVRIKDLHPEELQRVGVEFKYKDDKVEETFEGHQVYYIVNYKDNDEMDEEVDVENLGPDEVADLAVDTWLDHRTEEPKDVYLSNEEKLSSNVQFTIYF